MSGERASASSADAILSAAASVLAREPAAPIDAIAAAAGVSRATFYRHFGSRAELLAALDIQPDPDARQRVLAAATELIGRDGLRGMSIDELAANAEVSRASVYRLFPGKAALFEALLADSSPLDALEDTVTRLADRPPNEVLPAIGRTLAQIAAPRVGLLRSIFFEVTSQTPDALAGAEPRLRRALGAVSGYLAAQMAAGRMRRMHPVLAAQVFMGPIVFHMVTRAEAAHLGVFDAPVEESIDELCHAAVRALAPG